LPADPSLRGHLDASGAGARGLAPFAAGIDEDNLRRFLDAPGEQAHCGRGRYAKGRHRWQVTVGAAELDRLVAAELPQVGAVTKLVPQKRGISGRIGALEIVGTRGKGVIEGDLRIRRMLGGLKSTLFLVRREGASWVFEGAGFGHGVGMCQTGAIGMAELGKSYQEILGHYYQGTQVSALY
jgi:stage II sporulation protein D